MRRFLPLIALVGLSLSACSAADFREYAQFDPSVAPQYKVRVHCYSPVFGWMDQWVYSYSPTIGSCPNQLAPAYGAGSTTIILRFGGGHGHHSRGH